MDKQQRCSYRSNPRRLQVNQQQETRTGTNTEGSSVIGLQQTVTDDIFQVDRGTKKEIEASITQGKHLAKNGQHWDKELEPGDKAELLNWIEQLSIVAETNTERRYFNREPDKIELHVFAHASEDTMCAVSHLRSQPKKMPS